MSTLENCLISTYLFQYLCSFKKNGWDTSSATLGNYPLIIQHVNKDIKAKHNWFHYEDMIPQYCFILQIILTESFDIIYYVGTG